MKKPFDPSASDLLYVLTDAGERYLIPTMAVTTRTSLTLGPQMQQYRIDAP